MNTPVYDDQQLVQYLLNSLPDAEMEHFDGLSVSDAAFIDALLAAENDLVDAYVARELTGATRERFETHYLASPLRREKVELAKTFQTYAAQHVSAVAESRAAPKSKPPRGLADFFAGLNLFKSHGLVLRWGLAAAALVLFAGGAWLGLRGRSGQPEYRTVASFVLVPPLRGNNQITTLSIPRNTRAVETRLELESDDYSTYRVELTDESSGAEVWRSGPLKVTVMGASKRLEVRFPATVLKPQITYSAVVFGSDRDGKTEIVANYPFRIAAQ